MKCVTRSALRIKEIFPKNNNQELRFNKKVDHTPKNIEQDPKKIHMPRVTPVMKEDQLVSTRTVPEPRNSQLNAITDRESTQMN